MKENVSGCFFCEHSVYIQGTVGQKTGATLFYSL